MAATMQDTMDLIRKYAPQFYGKIGIILGSGLGAIADQLTNAITIPYQVIPGLQEGGVVSGHAALLVMGYLQDIPVICMKGRLHLYEGVSYRALRTLVRIIKQLGASTLIVTGAVGSLQPTVGPGEIVVLKDHIHLHPGNPLLGSNDESIGPRFVSLENAYDEGLRDTITTIGKRLQIPLHEGVYVSVLGPSFETPAEIRAYRMLGADVVGMSVVPEVIIARHCGLKVLGTMAVTNFAVGLSVEKVTHEVTLQNSELGVRKLIKLIPECVMEIGREG